MSHIITKRISSKLAILLLPALLALYSASASGETITIYPGDNAISDAVENSAPFDTIFVSPGLYPRELGAGCPHTLTVIGIGGAEMNEIRLCADLCYGALIAFASSSSYPTSIVEGLTVTFFDQFGYPDGIYVGGSGGVVVRSCIFRGLSSGVVNGSGSLNVTLTGNLFLAMRIGVYGGPTLTSGNTFAWNGIGMELPDLAPPTTVEANLFLENGWGVRCGDGSPTILRCNDVWGNDTAYWGCPDPTGQDGNIAADPLICDPNTSDFRLLPDSPCLPENSPPGCGLIGAFGPCELTAAYQSAPAARVGLMVEPNPIVTAGEFSFTAELASPALEIYDLQGRLMQVLIPKDRRAVWVLDASVPRGVYFARLRGAGVSETVKFLVIR